MPVEEIGRLRNIALVGQRQFREDPTGRNRCFSPPAQPARLGRPDDGSLGAASSSPKNSSHKASINSAVSSSQLEEERNPHRRHARLRCVPGRFHQCAASRRRGRVRRHARRRSESRVGKDLAGCRRTRPPAHRVRLRASITRTHQVRKCAGRPRKGAGSEADRARPCRSARSSPSTASSMCCG